MSDICVYSLYGFGSIDNLLNMKLYEIYSLKQMLKDDEVKDTFKKVKLHNFN